MNKEELELELELLFETIEAMIDGKDRASGIRM